jgi:hypothetical protein
MSNSRFYRRRLPHWQPPGTILFVTFRTRGSLPQAVEMEMASRAALLKRDCEGKQPNLPELRLEWNKLFEYMDDQLAVACISADTAGRFLSQS